MIIDTSAYTELRKGNKSILDIIDNFNELAVPLPVIAELSYGFMYGSRLQENEKVLQIFLSQENVRILSPTVNTTKIYAELAVMCRQAGRALSHNDLWIAALAREEDLTLVTFDKDFSVFEELMGNKLIIL